jgi:hypothetical protein
MFHLTISLFGEDTTYLPAIDSFNAYKMGEQKYSNFNVFDLGITNTNDHIISKNSGSGEKHQDDKPQPVWNNSICIDSYNDYYFTKNFSFLSSLNFFYLGNSVYNETIDKTVPANNYLTITEARLRYNDSYNNTYTVGILPMFKGIAYKYDTFDFTRNDGSHYMSSLILQGGSITHKFDGDNPLFITLGFGYYEKIHINNIELHNKRLRGSDGSFLYVKKIFNIDEYSKLIYHGEITKINYRYDGTKGFDQILTGNTLTYMDESNTVWGFWGHQRGEGDNTFLIREALNIPSSVPDQALYTNTPNTFVGPYTTTGDAIALGYKRSFDIGTTENFILGEYYKTFGEWVTPNSGEPFSIYGLGRLGTQYKISIGHFFDSNLLFRLSYIDLHLEKDYKDGGSMKQMDIMNAGLKDRSQQYVFSIQYLF